MSERSTRARWNIRLAKWLPPVFPGVITALVGWFFLETASDRLFSAVNQLLDHWFDSVIPPEYETWTVLGALALFVGLPSYLSFYFGIKFSRARQPEFFASRAALDNAYRPLHESSVHHAWAAFLVGRKLFQSGTGYEKLERLILPDPSAKSIADFENALPDQMPLIRDIRPATKAAISKGVEVRWCKHFTGHSGGSRSREVTMGLSIWSWSCRIQFRATDHLSGFTELRTKIYLLDT